MIIEHARETKTIVRPDMRCKVETVFIARAMEARKEGRYEMLYIVTMGMDDDTLASVPLHIAANGSLQVG